MVVSGDYGKPRPALFVQSDAFADLPPIAVLRLSSEIHTARLARIAVEPSAENGLRATSQKMIDKAGALPKSKVGLVIGGWEEETMSAVDRAPVVFLGLRPQPDPIAPRPPLP